LVLDNTFLHSVTRGSNEKRSTFPLKPLKLGTPCLQADTVKRPLSVGPLQGAQKAREGLVSRPLGPWSCASALHIHTTLSREIAVRIRPRPGGALSAPCFPYCYLPDECR